MVMACMIWRAMFGNGVPIGMALIIIAVHPHVILKDQVRAVTVFCGAVLGSTLLTTCVQLSATTSIQRMPTTTSVFVVCQDCRTTGPFPLSVRSTVLTALPLAFFRVASCI